MFNKVNSTTYQQPQEWVDRSLNWERQREQEITKLSIEIFLVVALALGATVFVAWHGITHVKSPLVILYPGLIMGIILTMGGVLSICLGDELLSRRNAVDYQFFVSDHDLRSAETTKELGILKQLPYHVRNLIDSFCRSERLWVTDAFTLLKTEEIDLKQHAQRMRGWAATRFGNDEPIFALLDTTNATLFLRDEERLWVIGSEFPNGWCRYLYQKTTEESDWFELYCKSECDYTNNDYVNPETVFEAFKRQLSQNQEIIS